MSEKGVGEEGIECVWRGCRLEGSLTIVNNDIKRNFIIGYFLIITKRVPVNVLLSIPRELVSFGNPKFPSYSLTFFITLFL